MLILIAVLLALLPAIAILYPFLRRLEHSEPPEGEDSPRAELDRRWDAALAGLKTAELELAIGNLSGEDHEWLHQQYMTEAAVVMKAMELEEQQEQELLASIDREVRRARRQALGDATLSTCPQCSSPVSATDNACPACSHPLDDEAGPGLDPADEVAGE